MNSLYCNIDTFENYYHTSSTIDKLNGFINVNTYENILIGDINELPFNTIGIFSPNSIKLEINKERLIMSELTRFFDSKEISQNFTFLVKNENVSNVLPSLRKFIDTYINYTKISLKLLDEGKNWQTLFLYVYTNQSWDEINKFTEMFYEFLFDNFPNEESKINISFIQE